MKVNPDEKELLKKSTYLGSGMRSKTMKKEKKFRTRRRLKSYVEGKVVTIIMSLVTVYALVGVIIYIFETILV
jgi:hypothetical protein